MLPSGRAVPVRTTVVVPAAVAEAVIVPAGRTGVGGGGSDWNNGVGCEIAPTGTTEGRALKTSPPRPPVPPHISIVVVIVVVSAGRIVTMLPGVRAHGYSAVVAPAVGGVYGGGGSVGIVVVAVASSASVSSPLSPSSGPAAAAVSSPPSIPAAATCAATVPAIAIASSASAVVVAVIVAIVAVAVALVSPAPEARGSELLALPAWVQGLSAKGPPHAANEALPALGPQVGVEHLLLPQLFAADGHDGAAVGAPKLGPDGDPGPSSAIIVVVVVLDDHDALLVRASSLLASSSFSSFSSRSLSRSSSVGGNTASRGSAVRAGIASGLGSIFLSLCSRVSHCEVGLDFFFSGSGPRRFFLLFRLGSVSGVGDGAFWSAASVFSSFMSSFGPSFSTLASFALVISCSSFPVASSARGDPLGFAAHPGSGRHLFDGDGVPDSSGSEKSSLRTTSASFLLCFGRLGADCSSERHPSGSRSFKVGPPRFQTYTILSAAGSALLLFLRSSAPGPAERCLAPPGRRLRQGGPGSPSPAGVLLLLLPPIAPSSSFSFSSLSSANGGGGGAVIEIGGAGGVAIAVTAVDTVVQDHDLLLLSRGCLQRCKPERDSAARSPS